MDLKQPSDCASLLVFIIEQCLLRKQIVCQSQASMKAHVKNKRLRLPRCRPGYVKHVKKQLEEMCSASFRPIPLNVAKQFLHFRRVAAALNPRGLCQYSPRLVPFLLHCNKLALKRAQKACSDCSTGIQQ